MSEERHGREGELGFGRDYLRGLHASALGNAPAYGYSVTITSTFGILSAVLEAPGVGNIFVFAAGAIVGFALIEAIASGGFRHDLQDEPSSVKALGSSISILSVGGSLGIAFLTGTLVGGFISWPLASFLATVSYLCFFALELSIAKKIPLNKKDS